MGEVLSYIYTVLSRIWDIISYPFEMAGHLITFIEAGWSYTTDILSLFPDWFIASIALCFALGIALFILRR